MDLIKIAEQAFDSGKEHPKFKSGDTITVAYRIKEGNKERNKNRRTRQQKTFHRSQDVRQCRRRKDFPYRLSVY